MRKLLGPAALVVLVVVALGCSSESDDDPAAETTTTEAEDGGETTAGDEGDESGAGGEPGESGEDQAGDDEGEAEPLGSATARLPASPNDSTLVPLRLDVMALERLEGMVELRVTLTNEGESSTPDFEPFRTFEDPRLRSGDAPFSVAGAQLVNADEERAYLTIIDSEGACLCTMRLSDVAVPAGESFEMYADFGAVPDDLEQVDVQVPGFPTIDAVPIG